MNKIRRALPGEGDVLLENEAPYVDSKICRRCTGSCCEASPGVPSPEDFGRTPEEVRAGVDKALQTSFWQVDYYEAGIDYFIRPAVVGEPAGIEHPGWPGRCTFLNFREGCRLPATRRPYQCRMLEPSTGIDCEMHGGDRRAGIDRWKEYSDWLERAEERLGGTDAD